jgi:hypothetical protein
MKFTIARADLQGLLKAVLSRKRRRETLTLSACAARVFAECKGDVAGIEALVFADGAVTLAEAGKFRDLLKTYKGTRFLTLEGDADGLQIESFRMRVLSYNPHPVPPADFQVFPVTCLPSSAGMQIDPSRTPLPGDVSPHCSPDTAVSSSESPVVADELHSDSHNQTAGQSAVDQAAQCPPNTPVSNSESSARRGSRAMKIILEGLRGMLLLIIVPLGIGLTGYWLIGQQNYENLLAIIAGSYMLLVIASIVASVAFIIIRAVWRKVRKAKR